MKEDVLSLAHGSLGKVLEEMTLRCGGVTLNQSGLLLLAANHPCPVFVNNAIRTGSIEAKEVLRSLLAFYAERGHACETWIRVGVDENLEGVLLEAGMKEAVELSGMVLRRSPIEPERAPGVAVRRVENSRDVQDFREVAADGFREEVPGLGELVHLIFAEPRSLTAPDTAAFVVTQEGKPAAVAMTMVKNGVGWIGWVATLPEFRGRGLGRMATAAASRAGFELGGQFCSLEATKMGRPVYLRLGYEEIMKYRTYWPAELFCRENGS